MFIQIVNKVSHRGVHDRQMNEHKQKQVSQ